MNKNKLSLTVGITTCFGDESMLDTVRSIRNSKGIGDFRFIIVADRNPIKPHVKMELKRYGVELIKNKKEGSQFKKQKQILALCKSDIIIFTNDDVLFTPEAIAQTLDRFTSHPKTTLISIKNQPVKATSFIESVLSVGTSITNRFARYWNRGDNYLSVIGRFEAIRTNWVKKFRLPYAIVSSDQYLYFENKRLGGTYEYIPDTTVYFKNPQNLKEFMRKSSRFQYSLAEMSRYFGDITKEYKIPRLVLLRSFIKEFISNPFLFICYIAVFGYSRVHKIPMKQILHANWEVDVSTKKILS